MKKVVRDWFFDSIEVSVVLKGIDGLLEIFGAGLLAAVRPSTIGQLVSFLTQHELARVWQSEGCSGLTIGFANSPNARFGV